MAGASLVERVRSHLERQAAWFENVLGELENLRLDDDGLADAMQTIARRAEEQAQWDSAQARLMEEWRRASVSVSEADRADIRDRSNHVRALADQVSAAYRRMAGEVETKKACVARQLAELSRGRELLRRQYVEDTSGWLVDKKA